MIKVANGPEKVAEISGLRKWLKVAVVGGLEEEAELVD